VDFIYKAPLIVEDFIMNTCGDSYNQSIMHTVQVAEWTTDDLLMKIRDYHNNQHCDFTDFDRDCIGNAVKCIEEATEKIRNAERLLKLLAG